MGGSTDPSGRSFRLDIQGLRAVAVLLVLAFHLWPETLTGGFIGVDVFFVISGFLITGHLLEHPPRNGRDLVVFWGRRIRRLLPAAFLVLLATVIASRIVAPETRWAQTATEVIASALYVENWALAGNAVNYLFAEEPPSPVQHYWSLSVEEQFYLAWPILLLAVFWLVRRLRIQPLRAVRLAMAGVIGVSLFLSITMTAADPASAYFVTQTRVWELAVGGLVATLTPLSASTRLAPRTPDRVAWLGLGMVVLAGIWINPETPFPGEAALLPVAGTALMILAAAEGRRSPTRLLGIRPIQHLGDTSYSIYLWHWPLIILWPYVFDEVSLLGSLAIVGITVVLATLTKAFVEDAYRFSPRFQALVPTYRFAAVGMLILSIVGGAQLFEAQLRFDAALASNPSNPSNPDGPDGPTGVEPNDLGFDPFASAPPAVRPTAGASAGPAATTRPATTADPPAPSPTPAITTCVGAASIVRGFEACPQDPAGELFAGPVVARSDLPDVYGDGCWNYAPFGTRITCTYGKGEVRIALVGNSHAGHWLPALQVLAKRHGWTITTYLASQCNATDAPLEFFSTAKTNGCVDYGEWAMRETKGDQFDLVVTSERQSVKADGVSSWADTRAPALEGYRTYLRRWSDAGTNLLVIEDTPFPGRTLDTVPDCIARHRSNHDRCAGTPESWDWLDPLWDAARELELPNTTLLESRQRFLCTESVCPAVIGTVIAYFDGSHMTETYARSIAPFIEAEILAALARSPRR